VKHRFFFQQTSNRDSRTHRTVVRSCNAELLTLSLANAKAIAKESALAGLILGTSATFHPFKACTLVPSPDLLVLLATDAAGEISLQTTPAGSPPPGTTLFVQYWIQDSAGPLGFAASNALSQTAP
jgi:hypothetical protein